MKLYFDIGGTHVRLEKVKNGISHFETIYTKDIKVLNFIDKIIREEKSQVEFIGISFAGQIKDGFILSSPNIEINSINIEELFLKKYNIKTRIENDLKCACLAEYSQRKYSKMLIAVYIGTGFGSAYIQNGKLIKGYKNLAGEIGHMPYKMAPFKCGCGLNECVELFASGSGIKKWIEYFNLKLQHFDLQSLKQLNNKHAKFILDNFYKALSFAFRTIAAMLNPDTIVLGGSVIKNNSEIINFIKKEISTKAFPPSNNINLEISSLSEGNIEGAKLLEYMDY